MNVLGLLALMLSPVPGQDWISFSVVGGFTVPGIENAMGIEGYLTQIILTDPLEDSLYVFSSTGTLLNSQPIDPGCSEVYGLCFSPFGTDDYWTFNDAGSSYLWRVDSPGSWTFFTNPAGSSGRGMDFDHYYDDIWQVACDGSNSVWRIEPDGSFSYQYAIDEVSGEIAGIAAFQDSTDVYLVVCGKTDDQFHVFRYYLGLILYIGSAAIPDTSVDQSLSICYDEISETFWWLYSKAGLLYAAELSITLEQALETSTWGQIKSLVFQQQY